MPEYIKREALIKELQKEGEKEGQKSYKAADNGLYDVSAKYTHGEYCYCVAAEITKDMPTADVVEVVRCKDCEHYFNGKCYITTRSCSFKYDINIHHRKQDDFCSYGKRKEGAEE